MEQFRRLPPSNPDDFPAFRKAAELERTQKDYRGKPIPRMAVNSVKKAPQKK